MCMILLHGLLLLHTLPMILQVTKLKLYLLYSTPKAMAADPPAGCTGLEPSCSPLPWSLV